MRKADLFMSGSRAVISSRGGEVSAAADDGTFGQSAMIRDRFAWVSTCEIKSALTEFCGITGRCDPASIDALSRQMLHRHQLESFKALLPRLRLTGLEDDKGRALRLFDQAQVLHEVLQDKLDSSIVLAPLVSAVMSDAAEGLFFLGEAQFRRLKQLAADLADWISSKSFASVVLVESPLGNCVPTQVIEDLCRARGLPVQTIEWGFPRNDRAAVGRTLRSAAAVFAKEPEVATADCVLFVDDVLTGTRFRKLANSLRKEIGLNRFAAVAMRFQFSPTSGRRPYQRRRLDKVAAWGAAMGLPEPVVEFPPLPVFTIDTAGPVYLESAVAWADQDLVAGKRKVNLVFETIENYEKIYRELCSSGTPLRKALENIWSQDTGGRSWAFAEGLIDKVFDGVGGIAPADVIFDDVRRDAITAFPADYLGQRFPLSSSEVRQRSTWLKDCLRAPTAALLGEKSGVVVRAVTELNEAGFAPLGRPSSRDHTYGHYTLPWHPALLTLNQRLRALIAAA